MLQIFSRHRQSGKESADDNRRKRLIGKTLDRRYRIIDLLGEGGFSHTYIAEDTRRPKSPDYPKCVVKHLRKSSNSPEFLNNARRLFRTEAETLERLGEHSQIPRLLAYFEEWREFYLVQEYIQGNPLSAEWQPGHDWSESQVYTFLCEMLEILAFVHAQGVIHRDVKPDNIIRRRLDRKLCLVDFGTVKQAISHVAPNSTQHTITTGTPGYIPIEQWRGNPQFNSDLYALGVVAVQTLTGIDPEAFQGNPERILRQHRPQITEALAAVIENMVRTDWHDRYPSVQAVLQALYPLAEQFSTETAAVEFTQSVELKSVPSAPASATVVSRALASTPEARSNAFLASDNANETILEATQVNGAPVDLSPDHESSAPENQTNLESSLRSSLPKGLPGRSIGEDSFDNSYTVVASPVEDSHPIATSRQWLFLGLGIAGAGAIAATLFFLILPWRHFQVAEQALKQAEQARQAGNYGDCLNQAKTIPASQTNLKMKAQELAQGCSLLMQAEQLASAKNFQAAIVALDALTPANPAYSDAQKLIQQWGDQLIQQAAEKYQKGNFPGAIALLKNLPAALNAKVQPRLEQWQTTWETNQDRFQSAQTAMEVGNWKEALDQASKIDTNDSPYWQKLVSQLRQEAQSNLEAAKKTLASEHPPRSQPESTTGWASGTDSYSSPSSSRQPSQSVPPAPSESQAQPQTATGSSICPTRVPGC
ncbi:MAG: serine/threonine-protein kinase [Kovacikia sp.]